MTKSNDCPRLAECLTDYLDHTQSEAERQSFVVHLEGCLICRTAVERAQTLQKGLQREAYLQPPEDVYRNVLREIRREPAVISTRPASSWEGSPFKWIGAFAVIAVIVMAVRIPRDRPQPVEIPPPSPPAIAKPVPVVPVPNPRPPRSKAPRPIPLVLPPPSAEKLPESLTQAPQNNEEIQLPIRIARNRREWEALWNGGQERPSPLGGLWQKPGEWLENKGVPKIGAPQAYGVKESKTPPVKRSRPPQVNFKGQMVIALPREAGAEITRTTLESDQIVVFYRLCASTSLGCGAQNEEPLSYFILPESDLPIVFRRNP